MRSSYRLLIFLLKITMRLFYRYRLIHGERIPQQLDLILAANHISAYDPPMIGAIMPEEIYILAKIELFRNPLFARFISYLNAIPVKRGRVDRKALERVMNLLRHDKPVLIFIEGTRKSSQAKAGVGKIALETGKDILPIYVKNSNRFWDCLLGKKRLCIVIGERIKTSSLPLQASNKENYRLIAEYVLNKIYELDNECQDS